MKHNTRWIWAALAIPVTVALVMAACRSGAPEPRKAERVVLVSFDGLGADLLESWLADPNVVSSNGLGGMASDGVVADRVRMANPTLTAVNHTTLITGAWPAQTGIVGNTFRIRGQPVTEWSSGYSAPLGVKPLWQRTREAGLRTGVLLWPGADGTRPEREGDFGVAWPDPAIARSQLVTLDPGDATPQNELPPLDGLEALGWRLPVSGRSGEIVVFELAVLDATPDGRSRYDTVAYRIDGHDAWRYLEEREWFDATVETVVDGETGTYGAWSKVLALNRLSGGVTLYRGAFNRLLAYPQDFADQLGAVVGPWPGVPDDHLLADWWLDGDNGIDLDTYLEQVERLDRYLDTIAKWVMEHEQFTFLAAYHPSPDEFLHSSLITNRDQWAWSEGRAFAARSALERVGRSTDAAVAELWSALDPEEDVLVVVSDHGHSEIHDEVLVNRALADAGLVEIADDNGRPTIAASTPMVAMTGGAAAHIYLNLEGREPDGVIDPADASDYLRRAARALADIGVEGEPVVEMVASEGQLRALGLYHPNSGDLVVFLKPGYTTSSRLEGDVIRPTRYYGQHGYLNRHDAMCGIFLARGGPAGRGQLDEIRAIDVAPKVAAWLGLGF